MQPSRPLDERWKPYLDDLRAEFGHVVDIDLCLRRFRNYYSEGQTSRDWQAKFENWLLNDVQRAGTTQGTDDLGIPYHQKLLRDVMESEQQRSERDDLIDLAVRSARERTETHD